MQGKRAKGHWGRVKRQKISNAKAKTLPPPPKKVEFRSGGAARVTRGNLNTPYI